jgi:hypothetical protein
MHLASDGSFLRIVVPAIYRSRAAAKLRQD